MSTIYVILGIIGWTTTAFVVPLYVIVGAKRSTPTAPRSNAEVR